MIGTGSDGESENVKANVSDVSDNIQKIQDDCNIKDELLLPMLDPVNKQDICDTDNFDAKTSDIQICDEAMKSEQDDIESPEWSDNDLQSWQSDNVKNIIPKATSKIPLCDTDSEHEDMQVISNQIKPNENILNQNEVLLISKKLSEETVRSEDSFLPITKDTFHNNYFKSTSTSPIHPSISPYSSPEIQHIPVPTARISKMTEDKSIMTIKDDRKLNEVSKNTARLKTKSINNINEKLDILKKKVDNFDATDIDAVEDEDPDYSDVDTENNRKRKQTLSKIQIKHILRKEELKKSSFRKVVKKLKEHKQEQKRLIDTLLEKNKQMDMEITRNQMILKQSNLNRELAEGNLKTVKSLKGNLMEDIDNQNSMILDKINENNQLKLELNDLKIKYEHLDEKLLKLNQAADDYSDVSREMFEKERSKLQDRNQRELQEALEKLEKEFKAKELFHEDETLKKLCFKEKEFKTQLEEIKIEQANEASQKDFLLKEVQTKLSEKEANLSNIEVKIKNLEKDKTLLEFRIEEILKQNELLEQTIANKENEIETINQSNANEDIIQSLKNQFSHMADTYETKIEKLMKENDVLIEKHDEDIENLSKDLHGKEELIAHLKTDLASIRRDYEERLSLSKEKNMEEVKILGEKIDKIEKEKSIQEETISEQKSKISKLEREFDFEFQKISSKKEEETSDLFQQIKELKEKNENLLVNIEELKKQSSKSEADNTNLKNRNRELNLASKSYESKLNSLEKIIQEKEKENLLFKSIEHKKNINLERDNYER